MAEGCAQVGPTMSLVPAECGLGQINSSSVKTGELGVTSYRGQQGAVHPWHLAHPCSLQGVRGPPW